jgi:hypothetical protein
MKKIQSIMICWLLIYCSCSITSAQPYESVFGKDTTQWNVVYLIPDYFPTLIFKAYGDTLINEQKYVPVYMGYYYTPLELYGYFKEDVDSGKLWFRYLNEQEELFMDLSLSKSDSFYFGLNEPILYTVDTIYYNSGRKYISFNEANYAYPILFIEGLGPFNMFYTMLVSFPEYAQIRCKKKDNNLVFLNSDSGTCLDTFTSVNSYLNENLRIFPNPTNGYINITTSSTESGTLELFNSSGDRVLSESNMGNGQIINIGYLPNGVYLVKYQLQNKQFTTKLTKQ